jgi:hypothetical protein
MPLNKTILLQLMDQKVTETPMAYYLKGTMQQQFTMTDDKDQP